MFFCIEERKIDTDFSMAVPHSHEHWELYFLLEGNRRFFIENKMFIMEKGAFAIIPPFRMHKTEGGPYRRININFSSDFLTTAESEFLNSLALSGAGSLEGKYSDIISSIIFELSELQSLSLKQRSQSEDCLTRTLIYFLKKQAGSDSFKKSYIKAISGSDSIAMKIAYYLNNNFENEITLKDLEQRFFLTKATLCKRFRDAMHCSIMEYLTLLRLNRAKSLLISSNLSMEKIAQQCGFSSANYMSLIFKKQVGISPLGYRKRVR